MDFHYESIVDAFYEIFSFYGEGDDDEIERVYQLAESYGLSVYEANEAYFEARDQFLM